MDRRGNGMIAMGECNRDGAPGTGPLGSGNDGSHFDRNSDPRTWRIRATTRLRTATAWAAAPWLPGRSSAPTNESTL